MNNMHKNIIQVLQKYVAHLFANADFRLFVRHQICNFQHLLSDLYRVLLTKMKIMGKTIIVSNRLPVKAVVKEGSYHFATTAGGLATGLNSIFAEDQKKLVDWLARAGSAQRKRKRNYR